MVSENTSLSAVPRKAFDQYYWILQEAIHRLPPLDAAPEHLRHVPPASVPPLRRNTCGSLCPRLEPSLRALTMSPIERTGMPCDASIAANSPLPAAGRPLTAITRPMFGSERFQLLNSALPHLRSSSFSNTIAAATRPTLTPEDSLEACSDFRSSSIYCGFSIQAFVSNLACPVLVK